MRTRLTPFLLLATTLTAAFVLACRLIVASEVVAHDAGADAVVDNLLGGSRLFVGEACFNRADVYFHRGMSHLEEQAFTNRWFQRMEGYVSPRAVIHREGAAGLRDVLPWVSLAAGLAPTNTDYVLTQAYLLRLAGDNERALGVLRQARLAMPADPELPLEEARLDLKSGRLADSAALLDATLRLAAPAPAGQTEALVTSEASMLRGLLHEHAGETNAAIACLARAAALLPRLYGALSNRVDALRANRAPEVTAEALLEQYRLAAGANPLCDHDHDHHQGHDDDGD